MKGVHLNLDPLTPDDIPDPDSSEFQQFLDHHFAAGMQLIDTMPQWDKHSLKHNSTVQIVGLPSSSSFSGIRKDLEIKKEHWCGRHSLHSTESIGKLSQHNDHSTSVSGNKRDSGSFKPMGIVRSLSHKFSRHPDGTLASHGQTQLNGSALEEDEEDPRVNGSEEARQEQVMTTTPSGLYERFRRGLLEYHSQNEREYIESCRETECLHVYKKHVAEVWRLTYKTPPPTNPRTFVVLLLSRELVSAPSGERSFMNISLPFTHPDCPEKKGGEKNRVRGRYVSVERVREMDRGQQVEWRMATSSDAGGNIPRFVTNRSLPNSISEDVPSFLSWMVERFPEGGDVASAPVAA